MNRIIRHLGHSPVITGLSRIRQGTPAGGPFLGSISKAFPSSTSSHRGMIVRNFTVPTWTDYLSRMLPKTFNKALGLLPSITSAADFQAYVEKTGAAIALSRLDKLIIPEQLRKNCWKIIYDKDPELAALHASDFLLSSSDKKDCWKTLLREHPSLAMRSLECFLKDESEGEINGYFQCLASPQYYLYGWHEKMPEERGVELYALAGEYFPKFLELTESARTTYRRTDEEKKDFLSTYSYSMWSNLVDINPNAACQHFSKMLPLLDKNGLANSFSLITRTPALQGLKSVFIEYLQSKENLSAIESLILALEKGKTLEAVSLLKTVETDNERHIGWRLLCLQDLGSALRNIPFSRNEMDWGHRIGCMLAEIPTSVMKKHIGQIHEGYPQVWGLLQERSLGDLKECFEAFTQDDPMKILALMNRVSTHLIVHHIESKISSLTEDQRQKILPELISKNPERAMQLVQKHISPNTYEWMRYWKTAARENARIAADNFSILPASLQDTLRKECWGYFLEKHLPQNVISHAGAFGCQTPKDLTEAAKILVKRYPKEVLQSIRSFAGEDRDLYLSLFQSCFMIHGSSEVPEEEWKSTLLALGDIRRFRNGLTSVALLDRVREAKTNPRYKEHYHQLAQDDPHKMRQAIIPAKWLAGMDALSEAESLGKILSARLTEYRKDFKKMDAKEISGRVALDYLETAFALDKTDLSPVTKLRALIWALSPKQKDSQEIYDRLVMIRIALTKQPTILEKLEISSAKELESLMNARDVKYGQYFGSLRVPKALELYENNLLRKNADMLPYLDRFKNSVMAGEFPKIRYQIEGNPHLQKIHEENPDRIKKWMTALPPSHKHGVVVVDTDDYEDLLLSGTEIPSSCLHIDQGSYNECLLAYLMDGKNRLLAIKDPESGKIIARSILRILIQEDGTPILFQERTYGEDRTGRLLREKAREKAKELGIPLAYSGRQKTRKLRSLFSPAPVEYTDSVAGKTYKTFTIQNWDMD